MIHIPRHISTLSVRTYFSSLAAFVLFALMLTACLPSVALAEAAGLDLSNAVIVHPKGLGKVEQKAITVLVEEVEKRTGKSLRTTNHWPKDGSPVIAVSPLAFAKAFLGPYQDLAAGDGQPGKEGYRIMTKVEPHSAVLVIGDDARGVLFGVGRLLRNLSMGPGRMSIAKDFHLVSSPAYPVRGHQLGYRPKTNSYDAWTPAQFDQYIRELAIFGANSIEIMPPRTDDDALSPHMKVEPMQMMIELSRIIDSYGLDVWIWYPNMGKNYTDPASLEAELTEREGIFQKLPRIDAVFVPGGDPGDLHPHVLFAWMEKVAVKLNKYHPKAKIWISPQAFKPTPEWLDSFYRHVNEKPTWFGGVVFGPWIKTPLPEIRRIVDAAIPIRHYPDITHSLSCQYPVPHWDLAFAMTLGRECFNPRPLQEKQIHNLFAPYTCGSISYSEGTNDDVNKFIWSGQDWDPKTPVIETLRDYSRFFIGEDLAEDCAQGFLAQEQNWVGPLVVNPQIEVTLQQWQDMEERASPQVLSNFRFQMGLMRAYYDAYIKERLIYEKELERQAMEKLRAAKKMGSLAAMQEAEAILKRARTKPVAQEYRRRCEQLADELFASIGAQLTVAKHGAIERGRGAFMDGIDQPLNDAVYLLANMAEVKRMPDEASRLLAIDSLIHRTDPGPGGFYDQFGSANSWRRVEQNMSWEHDPGNLFSPLLGFEVGLSGEEWARTVIDGFEGRKAPLAWMSQATTLYEVPLRIFYDNLDPHSRYLLKVAYTGRFRSSMRCVADEQYLVHDLMQTGRFPVMEFPVPRAATQDGKVTFTWTCGPGQRGSQVAEIWLIRK